MFSTLETAYSSVLDSINWSVFIFTRSYVGYICECYKRGCFENSYYLTESVKKPFSLGSN